MNWSFLATLGRVFATFLDALVLWQKSRARDADVKAGRDQADADHLAAAETEENRARDIRNRLRVARRGVPDAKPDGQ